jgi:hypothetical protein
VRLLAGCQLLLLLLVVVVVVALHLAAHSGMLQLQVAVRCQVAPLLWLLLRLLLHQH